MTHPIARKAPMWTYAAGAAALALVAWGVHATYFAAPKAPAFATATAAVSDLETNVLATGALQAFKQVSVGAQASGQIKSLKVALGDSVKKGQLIAEIDSLKQQNDLRNAQAALASAQAAMASRQAALGLASLAFKRQQELLAANAISRETFEQADAAFKTSQADVAASAASISQAKIAVDTSSVNLGYTKIVAPMDGVVVALVAQEGQTVNANQSTPTIIKLAALDTITVKAQISEADVIKVQPGQKVYFTILGAPKKRYYTTLRSVEPAPDSIATDTATTSASAATAIYYNGLLDVPNPDGQLRISMTAQVYIVLSEAKDALTIPSSALGARDARGMATVKVVGADGVATERKIKLGQDSGVKVQVLEGLSAGDKVVVSEAPPPGSPAAMPPRMPRM